MKISLSIFFCVLISCKSPELRIIAPASYAGLKENVLGESAYKIKLPTIFFLEEARGKEGQLGYGIYSKDSINMLLKTRGFIEVEPGDPIGGEDDESLKTIEKAKTSLLNQSVIWHISQDEKGRYYSRATYRKLSLFADSSTKYGLDSMISIISTLSQN